MKYKRIGCLTAIVNTVALLVNITLQPTVAEQLNEASYLCGRYNNEFF